MGMDRFWLVVAGTVMPRTPVALGKASVLYTFYPPMIGSAFYYLGVVLVVVGSWVWVALMSINLRAWKKDNPGETVPLAMFGNVAGAYLWAWTSVGAAFEVLFLILPVALGFKDTIDAGLSRVFLVDAATRSCTSGSCRATSRSTPSCRGHRRAPHTATPGSRRLRALSRVSMPIRIITLRRSPDRRGFKFVHAVFTAMVSIPTLLTVFTIVASVEIARACAAALAPSAGSKRCRGIAR